ncbi:hypothetical protein HZH66_009053 [Vespula vulgaris]|uniref:Uncharacterized protein n=1 Tax=Vespula vulgaris TaxID=7454 RepID=A0A834JSB7_VESVU|nr:hypothetical protein HZH66_009053 [Vespula vulgaris]
MGNYFIKKLFKCDRCSYSCVNKSMFDSNVKYYLNVYQYTMGCCSAISVTINLTNPKNISIPGYHFRVATIS